MKDSFIITLKERFTPQTEQLANRLRGRGIKVSNVFKEVGLIACEIEDRALRREIEQYEEVEAVSEDKMMYPLGQ